MRKKISVDGLYDDDLLAKCSQILKDNSETGVSKEVRDEIGGSSQRNALQQNIKKSVTQLLDRNILDYVVTVSDFLSVENPKSKTIIWNDSFIDSNHPTSLRSFKSRRGLGLEDLFKNVIAWHVWSKGQPLCAQSKVSGERFKK